MVTRAALNVPSAFKFAKNELFASGEERSRYQGLCVSEMNKSATWAPLRSLVWNANCTGQVFGSEQWRGSVSEPCQVVCPRDAVTFCASASSSRKLTIAVEISRGA